MEEEMADSVHNSLERWPSSASVDSWHSANGRLPEGSTDHLVDELERLRVEVHRVKYEAWESRRRLQQTEHHLKEVLQEKLELETLLNQSRNDIIELLKERESLRSEINELLSVGSEHNQVSPISKEPHVTPVVCSRCISRETCLPPSHAQDVIINMELVKQNSASFAEFLHTELADATRGFDSNLKIGEGGFGSVYKGKLYYTTVAIKKLNPHNERKVVEFQQEVNILTRVRHPNFVTLMGACSESACLVYEFLPNGSLEDRLLCKNGTEPLSWQIRSRIAAEICCALLFLHSARPEAIVHGDLKPDNVLLDANLTAKISDFGICRLLPRQDPNPAATICRHTDPKGTKFYIDPYFSATNELTFKSDVYAFGVILLQLLTGKPAGGLIKDVERAVSARNLKAVLDKSGGRWPIGEASELADLGLQCCEINRKSRPDLGTVWNKLKRYM